MANHGPPYDVGLIKKELRSDDEVNSDWMLNVRPHRRRPLRDEFDRDCGIHYDHELVFVRFADKGSREYECANCGSREYLFEFTTHADIHEMIEVGRNELTFAEFPKRRFPLTEQEFVRRKTERIEFHDRVSAACVEQSILRNQRKAAREAAGRVVDLDH